MEHPNRGDNSQRYTVLKYRGRYSPQQKPTQRQLGFALRECAPHIKADDICALCDVAEPLTCEWCIQRKFYKQEDGE